MSPNKHLITLMDEEEENIEKLLTFKHTIDVPELLKERAQVEGKEGYKNL